MAKLIKFNTNVPHHKHIVAIIFPLIHLASPYCCFELFQILSITTFCIKPDNKTDSLLSSFDLALVEAVATTPGDLVGIT